MKFSQFAKTVGLLKGPAYEAACRAVTAMADGNEEEAVKQTKVAVEQHKINKETAAKEKKEAEDLAKKENRENVGNVGKGIGDSRNPNAGKGGEPVQSSVETESKK